VPRAAWPCASRELWPDGSERVVHRFRYARMAGCQLPISLTDQGLVGCAAAVTTRRDGKTYDVARYRYEGGRMVEAELPTGTVRYDWTTGAPVSRDDFAVRTLPAGLQWIFGGRVSTWLLVDERNRPLLVESFDPLSRVDPLPLTSRMEFDWQGERLERIRTSDADGMATFTLELVYDCRALPKPGRPVNAGRQVGIPLP
jgi:hypothetical protein